MNLLFAHEGWGGQDRSHPTLGIPSEATNTETPADAGVSSSCAETAEPQ